MDKLISLLIVAGFLVFSSGCITMAQELYKDNFVPTPTSTTPIPTIRPTPLPTAPAPTPTPDPHILFKQSGGLNLNQWYNFTRRTFRDTIKVNVTIYRYQVRDFYSIDDPDQDLGVVHPKPGNRFLFIWVRTVSDSSTPLGGYDYHHFIIGNGANMIRPQLEPRFISELSSYSGMDHTEKTIPYGFYYGRDYEINKDNLTIKNRQFVGLPWFIPGECNAWDGYILYEIPVYARPENLIIYGDFEDMFHPRWIFDGGDVFSLARPPTKPI